MQTAARDPAEAAGAGAGGLARPRGREDGHAGWTANQLPSSQGVDGQRDTVQGWLVSNHPIGISDPDTSEEKYREGIS